MEITFKIKLEISEHLYQQEYCINIDATSIFDNGVIFLSKELYDICSHLSKEGMQTLLRKCIRVSPSILGSRIFDNRTWTSLPGTKPANVSASGTTMIGPVWVSTNSYTPQNTVSTNQTGQTGFYTQLSASVNNSKGFWDTFKSNKVSKKKIKKLKV